MGTFSERLRELRGSESQASFAASIGVNRVQYAKYESGQNSPSIELLKRICEAHDGVTADWLLGLPKSAAQTAAQSAAKSAPLLAHPLRGRPPAGGYSQTAAPGELPACAKCPFKEKVKAFEALARKPPGAH